MPLLQKTDKARLELSPGVRTLSLRERSLLLLADGKPLPALQAMYDGLGAQIVDNLLLQGYLAAPPGACSRAQPGPASARRGDAGEALRSLAGARMYLFDTCERLFARRDPHLAQQLRQALRAAKDRESMLRAGEAMFAQVALAAGEARAAGLRARFAQLVPADGAAPLDQPRRFAPA